DGESAVRARRGAGAMVGAAAGKSRRGTEGGTAMGVDHAPGGLPLVLGIPADGRPGSADLAALGAAEERLAGSARPARFPLCTDLPECRSDDGPMPPRLVRELYRAVAACDALLISAAEDGGPPPDRLLSALDWAGYPFGGVLTGTPAAVIGAGAEPAGGGGVRARLRAALHTARARVVLPGAPPSRPPAPDRRAAPIRHLHDQYSQ